MIALYDSKKPCSSYVEGGQTNGHKLSGAAGTADAVLTTTMTKEDQHKHTVSQVKPDILPLGH